MMKLPKNKVVSWILPSPTRFAQMWQRASSMAVGVVGIKRNFNRMDQALGRFTERAGGGYELRPSKLLAIYNAQTDIDGRAAFAAVVGKYGLTEADLEQRRKQFATLAFVCLLLALGSLAAGLVFGGAALYAAIGPILIASALWLKWSFRAFQVRVRSLCRVKDWVSQSGWYFEAFIAGK